MTIKPSPTGGLVSQGALDDFRAAIEEQLEAARKRQAAWKIDEAVDADPVGWITTNFYIPETGKPIDLYPSQEVPMRQALGRDADGNFIYSTVLWSAIKKSAKSSIAAAVGMWFAFRKPYSSIKVMGNDLKQAESRVYEYMRRAIMLREDWRATIQVNNYKMTFPNGSVIEAVPVDPTGEAGGNDDLLLYTELWGWKSQKHQQMWTESTLSPTKYGKSLRWCESYAGYSGESPVLEQLYLSGKNGRVLLEEYETYANDAARLFMLWNTRPTLPWQTPAYYAQEQSSLLPSEYARVHRNEWTSPEQSFLEDIAMFDLCKADVPKLEAGEPVVVAIDASVSGDCFAIVVVSRRGEKIYLRECHIWKPRGGRRLDYGAPDGPKAYLRELASRLNVVEFAYDQYQMHDVAVELTREGIGWFRPFQQGQERLVADRHFYDIIVSRKFAHDGLQHDLREHVGNANRATDGDKFRIVKRAEHLPIDGCVATSMGCMEAKRLNIG
jgi:phage terminase large subunit-like protein